MIKRKAIVEDILNSFHSIRHRMKAKSVGSGEKHPVTHSQWFVLGIIEHCENASIKSISESLEMSSSAVTQLVDGLVGNGYLVREEDPEDRRCVRMKLSAKGRKQIAAMKEKRIKVMSELFDVLTDQELETYHHLLKKICSHGK